MRGNVLLANAYNELPNKDIHRVSVADLAKSLGFNSHNEDHLKETLEALVDCTVKWNILGKDKKEEWGVASLLAEGTHQRWCLHLCLPAVSPYETLQPASLHETQFTLTKSVHQPICADLMGGLFRLF